MKCQDVHEWLGMYWDLPEHDLRRVAVDEHVTRCPSCKEEFEIWGNSLELIRTASVQEDMPMMNNSISSSVMNRIYQDDSWLIPVADRIYSFSNKFRRNTTALIACFLSIFMFAFFYSLVQQQAEEDYFSSNTIISGINSSNNSSSNGFALVSAKSSPIIIANASLADPFLVKLGPIRSYPDYLMAVSIIGMISMLLFMNWLSRTRI
jgi:hypothetical protein